MASWGPLRPHCPSMYWLGTSILLNTTVGNLLRVALKGEVVDHIPTEVPDGAFASATRFVHTRYLAGQAVLAVSVKEKIWAGREWPGIWCPCWCESCEAVQAPTLPWTASKASISNLNEIFARPARRAQSRLEEFWRLIAYLGVGQVSRDAYEHFYLRKYNCNALCRNTLDWLEQNRVPGFMLGVGEATCSRGTNTKAVAQRGTNPSVTVRASHGTAAQAMVAASQEQATATSEPLVPMTKEKKPVSTARMLHSEIVEDIPPRKQRGRTYASFAREKYHCGGDRRQSART